MAKLGLDSTGNVEEDYLQIKQGYEAKYHITWLGVSPLNDTYGVCTTRTEASNLGVTKISDLAGKTTHLTIATSPAGVKYGVDVVKSVYGFTFEKITTYHEEDLTFPAVAAGRQI